MQSQSFIPLSPESGSEGVVHDPHGELHGAEEEAQEEHARPDLRIGYFPISIRVCRGFE